MNEDKKQKVELTFEERKLESRKSMTPEKRYKLTKFFGVLYARDFERNEEQELINMLNKKKSQFIELTEKLDTEERTKLSIRWIQNLKKLKKYQSEDYHIYVIDNVIKEIQEEMPESRPDRKSNKTVGKPVTLKELFIDEEQYETVINLLLKYKLILERNGSGYSWHANNAYPGLSPNSSLCTLGFVLNSGRYLKPNTKDKNLVDALSSEFNLNISAQQYSSIKKSDSEKQAEYNSTFHFIKEL